MHWRYYAPGDETDIYPWQNPPDSIWFARNLIITGKPEAIKSPQGRGINIMSKSNVAEKFVVVPEVITEVAAPAAVDRSGQSSPYHDIDFQS